ncbi:MAG TPA: hypothetical protein VJN71_07980 [Nitrososphaerales archaeon]|nr:hypothetical protein [Nitrososphaerales archaeon]
MPDSQPTISRRKTPYIEAFSFMLELTIAIGAAFWLIYSYLPQYYLELSFTLLGIAGVLAYVILTKAIKF